MQLKRHLRNLRDELQLQAAARRERKFDLHGVPVQDPGIDAVVDAGMKWLCLAQDQSSSKDGGVARDYSLMNGWASSYPETTGYIIPTFIDYGNKTGDVQYLARAKRMLDWVRAIQFPEGGFQGGKIGSSPVVPVIFNTGQILIGLAAGVREFDDYRDSMRGAANWLVEAMDDDGCWRRYPTPFAKPGEKTYETHVAWGLLEAERIEPGRGYGDAALKNIAWALGNQAANGWFKDCCLNDPSMPLTHTLGYALRGIIEGYLLSRSTPLLDSACLTADAFLPLVQADGYLAGRWTENWTPGVDWVCLTGSVQIAHCMFLLYKETGKEDYLRAGSLLNSYVRRTVHLAGDTNVVGGVKGSFPVSGAYGQYEFLNWSVKFCVDANLLEQTINVG